MDKGPRGPEVVIRISDRGILNGGDAGTARGVSTFPTVNALRDGAILATFTWTYDRRTARYLNVRRRLSSDEGMTWTIPEDLGFADQPSRPAILPDGRLVVAWVDRFQSRSIRARLAVRNDALFLPETECVLYEFQAGMSGTSAVEGNTGELLAEMSVWNYGLPYAEPLPDGDVMVVYYEGTASSMKANWVRLTL